MKIKFKKDKPEQLELIKAMGSRDPDISREAVKIFAGLVGPLAKKVLNETNAIDSLYDTLTVGEYEPRTIPLDDFHNIDSADHVRVSMSSRPGDLASSLVTGADDIPFTTYIIDAAVSMYKQYLKAGRVSHAENSVRKMINEVRRKQKVQGIQPILDSLANSTTNGYKHVLRSNTANQLTIDDFNRILTLGARILSSGMGDTPDFDNSGPIVDTFMVSPEIMAEIRSFAYQPMNTRSGATATSGATSIAAPDNFRESLFNSAGLPSIYGASFIQMNEMGDGQLFNTFFDTLAGSVEYPDAGEDGDSASTTVFTGASEQLVLGISRKIGVNGLIKVEIEDSETGSTFNAAPDTSFLDREGKVGYYGQSQNGYLSVEPRGLFGLIV